MDPWDISLAKGGSLEVFIQCLQTPWVGQYRKNLEGWSIDNNRSRSNNNNNKRKQFNAVQGKEEGFWESRGKEKMKNESISYPGEGNFGSRSKEGETYEERRVKEDRKIEVAWSRTKAAWNRKEFEGRTRIEEERKRREVEAGRGTKARWDDIENNVDTSWWAKTTNNWGRGWTNVVSRAFSVDWAIDWSDKHGVGTWAIVGRHWSDVESTTDHPLVSTTYSVRTSPEQARICFSPSW